MNWMRWVLIAAGCYNLAWAMFSAAAPNLVFEWSGWPVPNYPQIWQGMGMVIGVFGIAYLCASLDPLRHWPVLVAGLISKVLGVCGAVYNSATGALPWSFALLSIPNDLIWWIPFGTILWRAWQQERLSDQDSWPFDRQDHLPHKE